MLEHCDFSEQVTRHTDNGVIRPDLVVGLRRRQRHRGREGAVRGVPGAMEARDDKARATTWRPRARPAVPRGRAVGQVVLDGLRARARVHRAVRAGRPVLDAALQSTRRCWSTRSAGDIVLATPATLVALLRTVAYAWRPRPCRERHPRPRAGSRPVHAALPPWRLPGPNWVRRWAGRSRRVQQSVGSLESRVLVSARKLAEMGCRPRPWTPRPSWSVARQVARRAGGAGSRGDRRLPPSGNPALRRLRGRLTPGELTGGDHDRRDRIPARTVDGRGLLALGEDQNTSNCSTGACT